MTDSPAPEPTPIVIAANAPTRDQIAATLRIVGIVVGIILAVPGFVERRDLIGLIAYLQTEQVVSGLGFVASSVLYVWAIAHTKHRANQVVTVAGRPEVPDEVAKLKGT